MLCFPVFVGFFFLPFVRFFFFCSFHSIETIHKFFLFQERVRVGRFWCRTDLLTGRRDVERCRRWCRRRRWRRYSSCCGANYNRWIVPRHLQHHGCFHGQVHWFQLHRRSRRLKLRQRVEFIIGKYASIPLMVYARRTTYDDDDFFYPHPPQFRRSWSR